MTKKAGSGIWTTMLVLAVALAGAVAVGIGPRLEQRDARARAAAEAAGPRPVRVATVRASEAIVDVTLPGTATPMRSSVLYSKSTGFVRENLVDLGDRVREGQVLAVIDAPETSEEIRLAKARLAEARANVGLATATSERVRALLGSGAAWPPGRSDVLGTHAINSACP